MDKEQELRKSQAVVLKALAHPVRLLLFKRLAKGRLCVCELTEAAGCDISTVSLHLSVMRRAGLVDSCKEANKVFYSLKCPCVLEFLECVTRVVKDNARHHGRLARVGRAK